MTAVEMAFSEMDKELKKLRTPAAKIVEHLDQMAYTQDLLNARAAAHSLRYWLELHFTGKS